MMFLWTPEAIETLKEMVRAGKSAGVIGSHFGVTRNAVLGKVMRVRRTDADFRRTGRSVRRSAAPSKRGQSGIAPARRAPLPATEIPLVVPNARDIIVVPMAFSRAMDEDRCLYFAADLLTEDGPDMPVCGCRRAGSPLGTRYCAAHVAAQDGQAHRERRVA